MPWGDCTGAVAARAGMDGPRHATTRPTGARLRPTRTTYRLPHPSQALRDPGRSPDPASQGGLRCGVGVHTGTSGQLRRRPPHERTERATRVRSSATRYWGSRPSACSSSRWSAVVACQRLPRLDGDRRNARFGADDGGGRGARGRGHASPLFANANGIPAPDELTRNDTTAFRETSSEGCRPLCAAQRTAMERSRRPIVDSRTRALRYVCTMLLPAARCGRGAGLLANAQSPRARSLQGARSVVAWHGS